ncbi:MAG TPA: hypothetical protein VGZ00_02295 [Candidatus Baltobacteraceae bacterium]|jgi:hypothetical protein|nr:hypothetical protein [Candidatus Baltobacteraceae bacterium]
MSDSSKGTNRSEHRKFLATVGKSPDILEKITVFEKALDDLRGSLAQGGDHLVHHATNKAIFEDVTSLSRLAKMNSKMLIEDMKRFAKRASISIDRPVRDGIIRTDHGVCIAVLGKQFNLGQYAEILEQWSSNKKHVLFYAPHMEDGAAQQLRIKGYNVAQNENQFAELVGKTLEPSRLERTTESGGRAYVLAEPFLKITEGFKTVYEFVPEGLRKMAATVIGSAAAVLTADAINAVETVSILPAVIDIFKFAVVSVMIVERDPLAREFLRQKVAEVASLAAYRNKKQERKNLELILTQTSDDPTIKAPRKTASGSRLR